MTPRPSSDATERFGWGAAGAPGAAGAHGASGGASDQRTTRYPVPPQPERVPYPVPPPYPGGPAVGGEPGFAGPYQAEPGFADLGFDQGDTDPGLPGGGRDDPGDPDSGHPGYGGYTTAVEPTPEAILVRVRPHARRLTFPVLILFATAAAYGWFGGRFLEEWQNWAALAAAGALVFFGTLLPFFAWLGHRYTVTTRRIIARRGLFVRDRQDLYLARVTDVRLRRTPFQAAAASGDIRVTAGPDLTVVLHDIPSARLTADLLGALTEHPGAARG